jgi:hypothetical protein
MNDAVVVCGVPNEKDIDGAAAVDVLVVGVAPAPETKLKRELELAGTADPKVDFVVVVGKLKLGGAAVMPNAVGATAVAVCEPKVGRDVVEVDRPKAIDDAVVVGNPKVVGAGAEVVMPKGGLVDVATVVEAPKVGADETEAPNTVGPPKLKDGAVAGLNSDREGVDVAPPVKLNGVDVVVVVGIDDVLLGICDSFSVASPKLKVGFSVDVSGLPNANVGFVCSVAPKENEDAELTGACLMSDGAVGFFPRISITLPVSSKDTFESGTAGAKLKMGLDLEADDVVVGATLNAAGLDRTEVLNCESATVFFSSSVAKSVWRPNTIGSSAFCVGSFGLIWNNSMGPVFSEATGAVEVIALVSSGFFSIPNLNPPLVSSVFLLGSIDVPNLKPTFSGILLGSTNSTTESLEDASIFLEGSITFPNLNPGVTLLSFDTSMLAPNLNPEEELSSFSLEVPKENPFVWVKVDDSVPNLGAVCCPG